MIKNIHESEKDFLDNYDASAFKGAITSVDTVIFTVFDNHLHVLTVKRAEHPFKDQWSLVGGFINIDKDVDIEATAKRKLKEKTGVSAPYLEQFGTIGNKKRDPRGWSVTTVYFALIPCDNIQLEAGKGATDIKWSKITNGKIEDDLAFDHKEILSNCIERLRSKVLYTSLPVNLAPQYFTLGELQKIYETILAKKLDHKAFRRRMLSVNILEETDKMRQEGRRPAHLYQLKKNSATHYFVRSIEGKIGD
jgi:ADP-ribose pyrophosphatase YjhB (NUDIX family)